MLTVARLPFRPRGGSFRGPARNVSTPATCSAGAVGEPRSKHCAPPNARRPRGKDVRRSGCACAAHARGGDAKGYIHATRSACFALAPAAPPGIDCVLVGWVESSLASVDHIPFRTVTGHCCSVRPLVVRDATRRTQPPWHSTLPRCQPLSLSSLYQSLSISINLSQRSVDGRVCVGGQFTGRATR